MQLTRQKTRAGFLKIILSGHENRLCKKHWPLGFLRVVATLAL